MGRTDGDDIREFVLPATLESVPQALEFVKRGLDELDCAPRAQTLLLVATDEIVCNVAKYAYGASMGDITIRLCTRQDGRVVEIGFIDQGIAFDPLQDAPQLDADAAVAQRRIGGQGIKIVKSIVDEVEYGRVANNNVLCIRKLVRE